MTDAEELAYYQSLPAWKRRTLFTIAAAPFAGMAAMIMLGMTGIIN